MTCPVSDDHSIPVISFHNLQWSVAPLGVDHIRCVHVTSLSYSLSYSGTSYFLPWFRLTCGAVSWNKTVSLSQGDGLTDMCAYLVMALKLPRLTLLGCSVCLQLMYSTIKNLSKRRVSMNHDILH